MFRTLLLATLFALIPKAAYAVDYDYEAARSRWQLETNDLDAADSNLARYRSTRNDTQNNYSAAVGHLDDVTAQLQANRDRQQALVALPLRVTAGSTLRLPTQFSFRGMQTSTFQFGKLDVSDARITSADGSTVSVGPSQWGPGSSPYRAEFAYVIPTALRGTTQWVTLYLKDRSTTIHVVKVPFKVQ